MNETTKTATITAGLDLYVITCPSASCGHQFAMQSYLPGIGDDDHKWFHAARVDFCPYCGFECRDAKPKTESAMNSPEVNTLAETLQASYDNHYRTGGTVFCLWPVLASAAQSWFDNRRAETLKQHEGKSLAQIAWEAVESVEAMTPTTLSRYTRIAIAVESAVLARERAKVRGAEEFVERCFTTLFCEEHTKGGLDSFWNGKKEEIAILYRECCPPAESKPSYFETAIRPPTAEDGNEIGWVEKANYGDHGWTFDLWKSVAENPKYYPLWRPVDRPPSAPPVSEDEKAFLAAVDDCKLFLHAEHKDGARKLFQAALTHARREQANGGKTIL